MADNDQGGTFRQTKRSTLGPSVGFIDVQDEVILPVAVGGITVVPLGYTMVKVTTSAAVTLQLPKFKGLTSGAIANPGTFAVADIKILGLNAAPNITILPGAGEFFDGTLSTIPLTTPFGARILHPDTVNGGALVLQ